MKSFRLRLFLVSVLLPFLVASQSKDVFDFELIPSQLTVNVNAVVRYEKQTVKIDDFDRMLVTTKRIVTVFNEYGNKHQNAIEFYDKNTKIKAIEAKIYDVNGQEIKKIKEKDFRDESAVSGGTLYSDSRVKYLKYTPLKYPYTLEFTSEVEMRSTAFLPNWYPINGYYLGIEYSEFQIINNSGIEIRSKKENFEDFNIEQIGENHFVAKNLKPIKYEAYNPGIFNITPKLKNALTVFSMEGVKGENNNWLDFGQWMYDELLVGTDIVPQAVIDEVKGLTADTDDDLEKAKIVYRYMQDKTRYISVQVGIGGWKPMDAIEVDKLGYSDCKGLTNYTKALLDAVGVTSYYTVVWGDEKIKNIDKDFSVIEGNHVILCLPNDGDNIFLECTSQTNPFGFIAGFTDDRDVLLITPEGGKLAHTKVYSAEDSQKITKASVSLDQLGNLTANVEMTTTGYYYNSHEGIQNKAHRDQKLYYKQYWSDLNNLEIISIKHKNNSDSIAFKEQIDIKVSNYTSKGSSRFILQPNMFNKFAEIPPRYSERTLDFKIQRAYKDVDEYIIILPEDLKIEAKAQDVKIENKFGYYQFSIEELENNTIRYKRECIINKGNYSKDEYSAFRNFKKQIVKHDKAKIVLIKNNQ